MCSAYSFTRLIASSVSGEATLPRAETDPMLLSVYLLCSVGHGLNANAYDEVKSLPGSVGRIYCSFGRRFDTMSLGDRPLRLEAGERLSALSTVAILLATFDAYV
jgi:hypothetical protein